MLALLLRLDIKNVWVLIQFRACSGRFGLQNSKLVRRSDLPTERRPIVPVHHLSLCLIALHCKAIRTRQKLWYSSHRWYPQHNGHHFDRRSDYCEFLQRTKFCRTGYLFSFSSSNEQNRLSLPAEWDRLKGPSLTTWCTQSCDNTLIFVPSKCLMSIVNLLPNCGIYFIGSLTRQT